MNRDGSNMHKLADDAGSPAWGQTPSLPAPTITGLNPSSAIFGSSAFTLTVNGTDFLDGDVVYWNDTPLVTTYVSPTQLTAQVTVADIPEVDYAQVTVVHTGWETEPSNALPFIVSRPSRRSRPRGPCRP